MYIFEELVISVFFLNLIFNAFEYKPILFMLEANIKVI